MSTSAAKPKAPRIVPPAHLRICGRCAYFAAEKSQPTFGACKRYPQTVPNKQAADGCGEFAARET
jgi:hypothetical protein